MNSPSHLLLHLWLRKYFQEKKNIYIPKSFVVWAIAPDIGLYLCVFIYMWYSQLYLGNDARETALYMFDILYFEHPLWIFAYNLFHSPLMILMFLWLWRVFQNYLGKYYKMYMWFLIGCMLHTFFDIPLHHNDGPRIFYPLSDYIFYSPVSYWNTDYYAWYIIPLELLMNLIMIFYVFLIPFSKKILWKK